MRFTTKEDCLNGFALLYVHRYLINNFEHVIDEFSCKNVVVVVVITPLLPRDGDTTRDVEAVIFQTLPLPLPLPHLSLPLPLPPLPLPPTKNEKTAVDNFF